MFVVDPILLLSSTFVNIGARYLTIELTPLQKEILKNKYIQAIILFSIIYMSVRDIIKTFFIVIFLYSCIYILFNENHKFNIISNSLINSNVNYKKIYYKNFYYTKDFKESSDGFTQ